MAYCDYYEYKSGFFGSHWCHLKDKEVSSEMYKKFCESDYSAKERPLRKNSSSSDCFLTTACVRAKNLPDNCYELETLRKFRDSYIKEMSNGDEIIKEYYEIAPRIVKAIENETNADKIFTKLFTELVEPCIYRIENNQNKEACELYQKTVLNLKEKHLQGETS